VGPNQTSERGQIRVAKSTVLIRAKDTSDLVIRYLRDLCPGASVPELYRKMVESGVSVGERSYIYQVMKRLIKEGKVRKDPTSPLREGRYYVVGPEMNLVLQPQREGKLLKN
jgi:hypothetical protein